MRQLSTRLIVLFSLVGASVQAQESDIFSGPPHRPASDSDSANQPGPARSWTASNREEMARDYIRLRAQEKAEARRARIEGMRALGYSPLRPTTTSTPFTSHPPMWSVSHMWAYPVGNPFWYHPLNTTPNLLP